MRGLLLCLLLLTGAVHADPFLVVASNSQPHGVRWEAHIEADGTVTQFVGNQAAPTVTMKLKPAEMAHLRNIVRSVDLAHVVWPPEGIPRSGSMSLLLNDKGQKNYIEWSGQKVDGAFTQPRIRFARVWVEALKLVPSPNDWETPDYFSAWLH